MNIRNGNGHQMVQNMKNAPPGDHLTAAAKLIRSLGGPFAFLTKSESSLRIILDKYDTSVDPKYDV